MEEIETYINGSLEDLCALSDQARGWDGDDPGFSHYYLSEGSTEIRFDLPEAAEVLLVVYNVTGREVARLVNQSMGAGSHRVRWDAGDLPSGVYLYKLTAGNYTDTKSMTLLR